jgi:hypothetical protein
MHSRFIPFKIESPRILSLVISEVSVFESTLYNFFLKLFFYSGMDASHPEI